MSRTKYYLITTYIFIFFVSINGAVHGHPDYNFQSILSLALIGSLALAIWILPIAFIIIKLIEKIKGSNKYDKK
jgi:hypothetical protein